MGFIATDLFYLLTIEMATVPAQEAVIIVNPNLEEE